MLTTIIVLIALAVSLYMNYRKGVIFSDVIVEAKDLLNKIKGSSKTEDNDKNNSEQ